MKKIYKKPLVYIEKFSVDKNFARYCGAAPGSSNHWNETTCSFGDFGVFIDGDYCDFPTGDLDDNVTIDGACYNNAVMNAFSS